jgi:hypothetical protein
VTYKLLVLYTAKGGIITCELQYLPSLRKSLRRLTLELGRLELDRRSLDPFSYAIFRDFVRNDSFWTEIRSSLLLLLIFFLTYLISESFWGYVWTLVPTLNQKNFITKKQSPSRVSFLNCFPKTEWLSGNFPYYDYKNISYQHWRQ